MFPIVWDPMFVCIVTIEGMDAPRDVKWHGEIATHTGIFVSVDH